MWLLNFGESANELQEEKYILLLKLCIYPRLFRYIYLQYSTILTSMGDHAPYYRTKGLTGLSQNCYRV